MTTTTKLGLTHLMNKQATAEVPLNTNLGILDSASALRIIATQNAPPGSPVSGDAYIVGTGSGAWATHDAQIAIWTGAWNFVTPVDGIVVWNVTLGELMAYSQLGAGFSSTATPWYPVQDRWSTSEHWTGRFHGGIATANRVWSRTYSINVPNTTTVSAAHSITNLDLTTAVPLTLEGSLSNATIKATFPFVLPTQAVSLTFGSTNYTIAANFNGTGYVLNVRVCYRRTGTP